MIMKFYRAPPSLFTKHKDGFHLDNLQTYFVRLRCLPVPHVAQVEDYTCNFFFVKKFYQFDGKVDTGGTVTYDKALGRYILGDENADASNIPRTAWYVQFSDTSLATNYQVDGRLQSDEIITLEHPIVGPVRDVMRDLAKEGEIPMCKRKGLCVENFPPSAARRENFQPLTTELADRPTPILVMGAERKGKVELKGASWTDLVEGKAKFDQDHVEVTDFEPRKCYISNFISMQALDQLPDKRNPDAKGRQGAYNIHDLRHLLVTAITGFAGARMASVRLDATVLEESPPQFKNVKGGLNDQHHANTNDGVLPTIDNTPPQYKLDPGCNINDRNKATVPRTFVHTGNWGCGVYGGDVGVMTMIQYAAARIAGIDFLVYHGAPPKAVPANPDDETPKQRKSRLKIEREHEQAWQGKQLVDEIWDEWKRILPDGSRRQGAITIEYLLTEMQRKAEEKYNSESGWGWGIGERK
ncbi:hypothetical protein HDV00_003001 [Rhizophlyctis rosea]|nr:hypothetical protein HDV00_003001 [Rhizophlyctis rosea]